MKSPAEIGSLRTAFLKALPISGLMAVLGIVVCRLVLGNYYEEYEAFFDAFYSGVFSPGVPFRSWYYMAHIGLGEVYSRLYEWLPGIEWMSWLMHAYLAIALTVWLSLTQALVKPRMGIAITRLVQVFVFVTLAADNVVNFNYTRVSYLLCGAALWGLLILGSHKPWQRPHRNWWMAFMALYALGAFTRVEPSLSVWLMAAAFGWLWTRSIYKTTLTLLAPALVTAGIVAGIYYDIAHTTEYYKQIEPDLEYQCNGSNVVPLSAMHTLRDSVLHEAAVQKLWADPQNLTIPFIESIILKLDGAKKRALKQLHIRQELLPYVTLYWLPLLLTVLIGFYLMYQHATQEQYIQIGRILLLIVGFLIILLLQTYFKKMRIRSFSPMFSMYVFSIFVYCFTSLHRIRWAIPALLVLVCLQLRLTMQQSQVHQDSRSINQQVYAAVCRYAKGEVLLLNAKSFGNFTQQHQPFTPFNFSCFQKVYINEAHVMSLVRPYRNYLEKDCNCDVSNFPAFYQYLLRPGQRPKVYLLSDAKRMDLTARYLQVIHGLQLHYQRTSLNLPLGWEMSLMDRQQLHLYELQGYALTTSN